MPVYQDFFCIYQEKIWKGIISLLWNIIVGDKYMKKLRSNIGWLIDRSKYDREFFRKRYDKSANTISSWCTGKNYPSAPILWDLATLLDVKVEELYSYEEE